MNWFPFSQSCDLLKSLVFFRSHHCPSPLGVLESHTAEHNGAAPQFMMLMFVNSVACKQKHLATFCFCVQSLHPVMSTIGVTSPTWKWTWPCFPRIMEQTKFVNWGTIVTGQECRRNFVSSCLQSCFNLLNSKTKLIASQNPNILSIFVILFSCIKI